jgi:hypothetical protein
MKDNLPDAAVGTIDNVPSSSSTTSYAPAATVAIHINRSVYTSGLAVTDDEVRLQFE